MVVNQDDGVNFTLKDNYYYRAGLFARVSEQRRHAFNDVKCYEMI